MRRTFRLPREAPAGEESGAGITWVASPPFFIPSAYTIFAQNRQGLFREQLFSILFFLSYILNLIFNYSNVPLKAEMIHFSLGFSVTPFPVKSTSETLVSTFDVFALGEFLWPQRGIIRHKILFSPSASFLRSSSLPPAPTLPRAPVLAELQSPHGPCWIQSPFPVVTAQLFPSPPDSSPALFTAPGSSKG